MRLYFLLAYMYCFYIKKKDLIDSNINTKIEFKN